MLLDSFQGINYFLVEQTEITGVFGNVYVGDFFYYSVESVSGRSFKKTVFSGSPFCVHHFIAFFPFFDKFKYGFGSVLQISVHYNDSFALAIIHTGGYGDLVAKISGKINNFHILIFSGEFQYFFKRSVFASVIYEDNLVRADWFKRFF